MLIKNNEARCLGLSDKIKLMPGVNKVRDSHWLAATKDGSGFKRGIKGKIDSGSIEIIQDVESKEKPVKVTIKLVEETYDSRILSEWLETAKGPLKGAIKAQLEKMKEDI